MPARSTAWSPRTRIGHHFEDHDRDRDTGARRDSGYSRIFAFNHARRFAGGIKRNAAARPHRLSDESQPGAVSEGMTPPGSNATAGRERTARMAEFSLSLLVFPSRQGFHCRTELSRWMERMPWTGCGLGLESANDQQSNFTHHKVHGIDLFRFDRFPGSGSGKISSRISRSRRIRGVHARRTWRKGAVCHFTGGLRSVER